ncbi:uncharacterized protein BDZ99DRAFT_417051 [Mytilinidion resinicola]|uniref:gamma-glutamylcyclotransferase n=1 Tax=Mytilinidion resinicola TaxID=574789 RepID=A0A6A6YR96_9PEZI|nr:uncharacterized protein BDZ99DRAFT_417051 [Mytilinidion resinicola]KAF2810554.1 hypothetical protein BDZ99DRAFT_417051 [Mytilinidion resinicola]
MSSRPEAQAHTTSDLDRRAPNSTSSQKYAVLQNLYNEYQYSQRRPQHAFSPSSKLPLPSQDRLDSSLTEQPYNLDDFTSQNILEKNEKRTTVLYLAYGSNLCDETFLGRRGIKPLSQINVLVPSLRLTFDLPGIPYNEPCFANTARRDPTSPPTTTTTTTADYHKDRWHKGLVGTVYEVSRADYAHIIATEGGGAGYHDIVVACHALPAACRTVPAAPASPPFRAHTLFAPAPDDPSSSSSTDNSRLFRPDPAYAQPSARYLKLVTDGASERGLPAEYLDYLRGIRAYRVTSRRQEVGRLVFLGTWMPVLAVLFQLQERFKDERGRSPAWVVALLAVVFGGVWGSYDGVFRPLFGDGERTEGEGKRRDEEV